MGKNGKKATYKKVKEGNTAIDSLAHRVKQKLFLDKDPIERLRKSEALSKIRGYVDTAVSVAKTINDMGENPSLRNYIALATIGIGKLLSINDVDFYADKSFDQPPFGKFSIILQKLMKENVETQIFQGARPNQTIQISKLYGETFVFDISTDGVDMFYVTQDQPEEDDMSQAVRVRNALGRIIWETYGNRIKLSLDDDKNCLFEKWDLGEHLTCVQTENLIGRIKKFRKAGLSRTIMLYGSPGTGKSSMARAVVREFNYPTVFIEASSAKRLATHHLYGVIALLCPGTLIVDDFDHLSSSDDLLALMNEMGSAVSIFIATINDLFSMNPAVIRAGRFNEIEEVERILSPAERFPQFPAHIAERVDQWPIAFIVELSNRMEVLGPECVDVEYEKLARRVKRNKVKNHSGFDTFLEMLAEEKKKDHKKTAEKIISQYENQILKEIEDHPSFEEHIRESAAKKLQKVMRDEECEECDEDLEEMLEEDD